MKKNLQQKKNKQSNLTVNKHRNKNLKELYNKGKVNYIITHGILSWGLTTGIIFIILTSFFQYGLNLKAITENLVSTSNLIILVLFSITGYIWGSIMWKFIKRKF